MKAVYALVAVWLVPMAASAHTPLAPGATVKAPGEYVLAADSISKGEFNIRVEADNVSIDLDGHTVRCDPPDPGTTLSYGIFISARTNVRIHNGKITGCYMGVNARDSNGTVLEGIDFTGNTYIGAQMGGSGGRVSNCVFENMRGFNKESYAIGLNNPGSDSIIENSVFRNLHRQPGADASKVGEGVGIIITAKTRNATVRGNWFEQDRAVPDDIGIWIATGSTGAVVEDNALTGFHGSIIAAGTAVASILDNRLWLREPLSGSRAIHGNTGKAEGNVIVGFDTPISGKLTRIRNKVYPQ